MVSAPRLAAWFTRHWAVTVVLALTPGWTVGVCTRDLWKPDEPREAAIAARMAREGADWAVPHLGTEAFCEKPPLTYWVAAASARLLGGGVVPLRLPNLAYGLLGALLVATLARTSRGPVAGLAAGFLFGTTYLAFRVGVWLATDAPLMLAVAGALLGCLRGLEARRSVPKLAWYAVMHLFLAFGFLTKNVLAFVVPGLAWLTVVVWERRWRELLAWELLAPALIEVGMVVPWLTAVAGEADGAAYLTVFFRNNIVGRFTPIEGVGYTESHPGWPGKYLVELPVYLFPWMLLMVAAAVAAWRRCRAGAAATDAPDDGSPTPWRFAVGAVVPPLLLLSAAASMRDVYAGTLMPGCALLGGLWAAQALGRPTRLDLVMTKATTWLLLLLCIVLPPFVLTAGPHFGAAIPHLATTAILVAALGGTLLAMAVWRQAKQGRIAASLAGAALITALSVPALAPVVVPLVNRAQNLRPVALMARDGAGGRPLALWQPDETIIAVMDFELGLTPPSLRTEEAVAASLTEHPELALLAKLDARPGRARESWAVWRRLGLEVLARTDLPEPGGRKYVLLGRPVGSVPPERPPDFLRPHVHSR